MKTATVKWAKTARLWVNGQSRDEIRHKIDEHCPFEGKRAVS